MWCMVCMRSYMCNCEDFHNCCEGIDRVGVTTQMQWLSNTVGEMPGIVILFSWNSRVYIIYIGYDVINILDVMSYLFGCDVIKCSCEVMHTECDVIHIVCNVIQRVGVTKLIHWFWWHRYSACSFRYRGWDDRYNFCVVMCGISYIVCVM